MSLVDAPGDLLWRLSCRRFLEAKRWYSVVVFACCWRQVVHVSDSFILLQMKLDRAYCNLEYWSL